MNKVDIIHFLEKYKKVCTILNLSEDIYLFDEIISYVADDKANNIYLKQSRENKNNEKCFYKITSTEEINIYEYDINQEIINNKNDILNYWTKLDIDEKKNFTIFELNIIMYFLTKTNNKYLKKEKTKLIMDIDMTVRNKRMSASYNNITV